MTIKILSLPQLVLSRYTKDKGRFLERSICELRRPNVNVAIMDDFKKDTRINLIKLMTDEKKYIGTLYYSETFNGNKVLTINFGSGYGGPVFSKNYAGEDIADAEQWPEEGLREKHIKRINKLKNIKKDLNLEEIAEKYEKFLYSLNIFR
jgi:hypothetical protein